MLRRVGFANVAQDGPAGKAAIDAARGPLIREGKLIDLADGPARQALELPVDLSVLPEVATLARARGMLAAAQDEFAAFEYDTALDGLRQADAALRTVAPTPDVIAATADVNLLMGVVYASRADDARALEAFRVVRRLAPERTALDAARYRPTIVALYERAGRDPGARSASFTVTTEPRGATVWIDGREAGTTPFEATGMVPGDHYVAATLDGHAARVERLHVDDGKRVDAAFLLARLPPEERARSVRVGLIRPASGARPWRAAAAALADVASVDLLVMVRQASGGAIEGAIYEVRTDRLSPWVPVDRLGKQLPPPPKPITLPGLDDLGSGVGSGNRPPVPWYRTWWGVSSLIGGSVLVTATILLLSGGTSPPPTFQGECCTWLP